MLSNPGSPSVIRYEQDESPFHGIAEQKTLILAHEPHRIPKPVLIWVGEDQLPRMAAVGGFVEAGLIAGAAGHDDCCIGVEGLDAAEV